MDLALFAKLRNGTYTAPPEVKKAKNGTFIYHVNRMRVQHLREALFRNTSFYALSVF